MSESSRLSTSALDLDSAAIKVTTEDVMYYAHCFLRTEAVSIQKHSAGNKENVASRLLHAPEMVLLLLTFKPRNVHDKERLAQCSFDFQVWKPIMVASPQLRC